jgi:amino acid transporter
MSANSRPPDPTAAEGRSLGYFLCWAVVFADIGTSVYYTPGILYHQVGVHAALFVCMTLVVFVLLSVKYSEVAIRYPEGGGVVTVSTRAIHPLAGLVGGLFILVDYFLTSSLSALSGVIYMSVLIPALGPVVVRVTLLALAALGLLNLMGVKSSARASAVVAVAAGVGQLAVVVAVLVHVGLGRALAAFPLMFSGSRLTPLTVLTGYAGAFLAFSGLESIAQLSPAMAEPRARVARVTMGLVVISVGLTSPLLTLWSTTLLDAGRVDPNQFISLLGGFAAGPLLQYAVAVTGALLLVFASNTALIGAYHVFLALSRMRFLPTFLQQTNRWRGTPHWAIIVGVGVPLGVVALSRGDVGLLGDLYAFGLLGAFTLTCLSLDIVRWHERREHARPPAPALRPAGPLMLAVGFLTTALVGLAWATNLVAKPLATLFGGGLTVLGLGIAFVNWRLQIRRNLPIVLPHVHWPLHPLVLINRGRRLPRPAVVAMLPHELARVPDAVRSASEAADGGLVAFVYDGSAHSRQVIPGLLEIVDPYLDDLQAQAIVQRAAAEARREDHHPARYVYLYLPDSGDPSALDRLLSALRSGRSTGLEEPIGS